MVADGFGWSGVVKIGRKSEWLEWRPPAEMRRREAAKGHAPFVVQEGGLGHPLGARAMYLYKGGRDTIFRIHGTNQPWTIGLNMSSGCIRMMNKDVEHLYERADIGAKVIVVSPATSRRCFLRRQGRRHPAHDLRRLRSSQGSGEQDRATGAVVLLSSLVASAMQASVQGVADQPRQPSLPGTSLMTSRFSSLACAGALDRPHIHRPCRDGDFGL